ncbi:MAG: sigma-70 family RNA polymerase sigma factor, partial [Clostridiales bacterium]|nr:sigma-70 family RNA polymerase sigma factor [Clostridiales bacterium]
MSDDKIFEEYAKLVRSVKSGDEGACEEIYNRSKRLVYATCYGILNNNEDAQDAMQETYMTVFTKIDELTDENKFLGWLKRVAASKSLDMYRKKRGDISYDEIPVTEGDDDLESLPDAYIMEKTKRDILNQILRRELSDVQYQTILLYYYDELPVETIAKLMNCPEGTVKTRLKSSRIKIKAAIEEYEDKNKDYFAAFTGVPFLARFFMEVERDLFVPQVKIAHRKPSSGTRPYDNAKIARKAAARGTRKTIGKAFFSTIGGKIAVGAAAIAILATGTIVVKTIIDKMDEPGSNRHSEREDDDEEA